MNTNEFPTDHQQAKAFLAALAPDSQLTFQTFAEGAFKDTCNIPPQILHGPYEKVCTRLSELNNQGHGIFVMVNQGTGQGRNKESVSRVRAHFLDLDGAPIEPVLSSALPPHIVVESSPDKWHAYWCTTDSDKQFFKSRQQSLAHKFGGDPAVNDLCRVMRLPGFWHLKNDPFMTRLHQPSSTN